MNIRIIRDASVFGNVRFRLWNINKEQTVPHCVVYIDDNKVISDNNGVVSVTVPINRQKSQYKIKSDNIQVLDSIVYMPCGVDDVICVKDK